MTLVTQIWRGSAFTGPLLCFVVIGLLAVACGKCEEPQDPYASLKECVKSYWQAKVEGQTWSDTDTCCGSIETQPSASETKRIDPVAREIQVERFELIDLKISEDLTHGTVKVWLEYRLPMIPTSLTKTLTETWDLQGKKWARRRSNLNAVLAGASGGG